MNGAKLKCSAAQPYDFIIKLFIEKIVRLFDLK